MDPAPAILEDAVYEKHLKGDSREFTILMRRFNPTKRHDVLVVLFPRGDPDTSHREETLYRLRQDKEAIRCSAFPVE